MARSIIGIIGVLALVVSLASCTAVYQHADAENPCSSGNKTECERWKKNFPKEYERYKERIRKSAEVSRASVNK